jgi:hypothetical protein
MIMQSHSASPRGFPDHRRRRVGEAKSSPLQLDFASLIGEDGVFSATLFSGDFDESE